MTTPAQPADPGVSAAFISQARELLTKEYLPKVERCLEHLADEQVWWRANANSNSIGNLILHISGNARQWIVVGLGGAQDNRRRDAEFAERQLLPREELLAHLKKAVSDIDQTLASFDTTRLLDQFHIQGTTTTALAAILHVTEHFSMHTGQIILLAKMLADVDFVFYDFSTGKPVHTWHEPK
ncbi:MAG: DinB family protein [bacterium]